MKDMSQWNVERILEEARATSDYDGHWDGQRFIPATETEFRSDELPIGDHE